MLRFFLGIILIPIKSGLIFLFFFLSASVFGQTQAAFLNFNQANLSVNVGATFDIQVRVDSGSDQITSTVGYIVYDASLLKAQSVTPGSFFPSVISNITSGKVHITGLVASPGTYQTGSGTVATIAFKALANGTSSLSFDCQTNLATSSKIIKNDLNATNIIECSKNGSVTVTVKGGPNVTKPAGSKTPGVTKPGDDDKEKEADGKDEETSKDKESKEKKDADSESDKEKFEEKVLKGAGLFLLFAAVAVVLLILRNL